MWTSMTALIILSFCLGTAAWLVFIFASKKGRFDDLEDAKYRMLEDDDEVCDRSPKGESGVKDD